MMIDTCASGGRRNDLETLRRAVPLHPTDYNYSHLAVKQAFHATMFQWMPYFGSNTLPVETVDTYAVRSGHGLALGLGYDLRRDDLDYDLLRKLIQEWRRIAPYYYGDFYPLTPYSWDESGWLAWQFDRPEQGDGLIEAFRRGKCDEATQVLRLHGLDEAGGYDLTDLDAHPQEATGWTMTGKELMEDGLTVGIASQPGATIITYKRKDPNARP
jgi:alpha-galactosidase